MKREIPVSLVLAHSLINFLSNSVAHGFQNRDTRRISTFWLNHGPRGVLRLKEVAAEITVLGGRARLIFEDVLVAKGFILTCLLY